MGKIYESNFFLLITVQNLQIFSMESLNICQVLAIIIKTLQFLIQA